MHRICPVCNKPLYTDQNHEFQPFCSQRCKLIDLGDWLSENYCIQGHEVSLYTRDKDSDE